MGTMPILTGLAFRVGSLRMLLLELSSILDQKAAFSLTFFALNVSIASVILSIILALLMSSFLKHLFHLIFSANVLLAIEHSR